MKTWLLDTGPIIAYLDPHDPFHSDVAQGLGEFNGRLCTTSAVITEAMHFVAPSRNGPALLAEFASTANFEMAVLKNSLT